MNGIASLPAPATHYAETLLTVAAIPNVHYTFTGWPGGLAPANDTATLAMNRDTTLTANFSPIFTLTINPNMQGAGIVWTRYMVYTFY